MVPEYKQAYKPGDEGLEGYDNSFIDSIKDYGSRVCKKYSKQGVALLTALGMGLGGCAASNQPGIDNKTEPAAEHGQKEAGKQENGGDKSGNNGLTLEERAHNHFSRTYKSRFGGAVTYHGWDGDNFWWILRNPENDPSGRDKTHGWQYLQFDDFLNDLGLGDNKEEMPMVVEVLTNYMRDQGVTGYISDNYKVIEVKDKGDLENHPLIKQAERGDWQGFILAVDGEGNLEETAYASPDLGTNPSRYKGIVARRDKNDRHGSNWGHIYWKNDTMVRIPDTALKYLDLPDKVTEPRLSTSGKTGDSGDSSEAGVKEEKQEADTAGRTEPKDDKEKNWCMRSDENMTACILGGVVFAGLAGFGIYSATQGDSSSDSSSSPSGGGSHTGGGDAN
ncbi:MAG: hypothetical protein R6U32_00285 [Candidatus Woesearchaeota archaeon]